MIYQKPLEEADALAAVSTGEFPVSLRISRDCVAIVLTQDWCPQWTDLKSWLDSESAASSEFEIDVYWLEYNRVSYGDKFMRFKESVLGNSLIPYVRYYLKGDLVGESNYVSGSRFLEFFSR